MNCGCHDQPAYWQKDSRMLAGGYWQCAVQKRAVARRVDRSRTQEKTRRQRERYDRDPIFRIEKLLYDAAQKRRKTLERRRLANNREG